MVVLLEILVFIVPMYAIHREMAEQKLQCHEIEAARLSAEIEALKGRLADLKLLEAPDVATQQTLQEQIQFQTKRYLQHEHVQTWPVDVDVRRRFALRNLTLLLPLVPPFMNLFDVSVT